MSIANTRGKREYSKLVEKAIAAMHAAINSFNSVYGDYKTETTLILLTNAWEILGKAVLIKHKEVIRDKNDYTISARKTIEQLKKLEYINHEHSLVLQQVISLRDQSIHYMLPKVPHEVQHHLFFFSCKFFKDTINNHFKAYKKDVSRNYLSISFNELTTYADKVKKLISTLRKKGNKENKELVWLLERGISYSESSKYIKQDEFEKQYKNNKKIIPHLRLNKFINNSDMVRIAHIQAPASFTADIKLSKSKKNTKESLPVITKKTNIEDDYPYLTGDLVKKLGKNRNFIAMTIKNLELKKNETYHQHVRTSSSSVVHRYSNQALDFLRSYFKKNPEYSPYKK